MCDPRRPGPSRARRMYSASSGKWCRATCPPRDPNGRSSLTRPSCSISGEVLYSAVAGGSVGSPSAQRLIFAAAKM